MSTVLFCKTGGSQRLVLLVSLDEVSEIERDREMCCGERRQRGGGQVQERDVGSSRSHGWPQDLVVEVAHFP